MNSEVFASVHRALQLYQAGELREAHALYALASSLDPAQAVAIHLLGYIAYQTGILDTALRFVNFRYDNCAAKLAEAEAAFGVEINRFPEVDMFDDLDETAALMLSVGLVIPHLPRCRR
jgi:hypothetical protein